jgi:hypothetical protein
MRIDPQQPERLLPRRSRPVGGRRHRAGRKTMVAAQHERERAIVETLGGQVVQLLADPGDIVDVLLPLVAQLLGFGDRRSKIASIDDGVTELGNALGESGNPQSRRPHIDAAPVAAKVEGDTDNLDLTHKKAKGKR